MKPDRIAAIAGTLVIMLWLLFMAYDLGKKMAKPEFTFPDPEDCIDNYQSLDSEADASYHDGYIDGFHDGYNEAYKEAMGEYP